MTDIICKECGELKHHHAKGLCKRCYNNTDTQKEKKVLIDRNYRSEHSRFKFLGKTLIFKKYNKVPKGMVYHHLIYDLSDPESNMVLMDKSSHPMIHGIFRSHNVKMPIIKSTDIIDSRVRDLEYLL